LTQIIRNSKIERSNYIKFSVLQNLLVVSFEHRKIKSFFNDIFERLYLNQIRNLKKDEES